jgi:hypothetical protein
MNNNSDWRHSGILLLFAAVLIIPTIILNIPVLAESGLTIEMAAGPVVNHHLAIITIKQPGNW